MSAIQTIKETFDKLNVYYKEISDKEIAVVCPADRCVDGLLPQRTIILDPITTCLTDDGLVHILENEDGELDWLVTIDDRVYS